MPSHPARRIIENWSEMVTLCSAVQLILGFFIFLLPWAPLSLRAVIMPIHVYSGLLLFAAVIATVLMGVTEKLFFVL